MFFFLKETDFLLLAKALGDCSLNSTGKWSLTSRACKEKREMNLRIEIYSHFSDEQIQALGWKAKCPKSPNRSYTGEYLSLDQLNQKFR